LIKFIELDLVTVVVNVEKVVVVELVIKSSI